ncbi:MAG: hypothetical protein M3186_04395, partial [Actinomycetota bacterium]|nr:hypothetical protein [Actinomycetota bacterium]
MTYRSRPAPRSPAGNAGLGCLLLLVGAGLVFLVCVAVAPYYSTQVWWSLRQNMFWLVPLIVVLLLAIVAGAMLEHSPSASGGMWLLTAGLFIASICFWVSHSYLENSYYAGSVRVTTDPVAPLAPRPPFNVSEQQVRPNLGDINGDTQKTMYLPDQQVFTTPVEYRGVFTGYQTLLVQHITDTGRNTPQLCRFGPTSDRRFGGLFSHSLARLINTQQRFVNWDSGDVYGYCDAQGHPRIVVPLKEQDGWLVVVERPAGLAVYDGQTGKLSITTDPQEIAKIPGPTYPLSLASYQRGSLGAIHGFWDWMWSRAGWELPDDIDAINSGNTSEFVVATAGDRPQPHYTNLLTGRGSATAVSAISLVNARLARTDQLAPLVVHRTNPNWLSTAAIRDRIHADFGDVFRD